MNIFSKIGSFFAAGYHHILAWVAPEIGAGKAMLTELEADIDRIGPQAIFDAASAALATVLKTAAAGSTAGAIIMAASDIAIATLKADGKSMVSVSVFGALSAAMLKMDNAATASGITVPPATAGGAAA